MRFALVSNSNVHSYDAAITTPGLPMPSVQSTDFSRAASRDPPALVSTALPD